MMVEAIDRELELVKLQIAAEDCHSEVEIYSPMYVTVALAMLAIAFSLKMSTVIFLMFIGVLVIMLYLTRRTFRRYDDGIRKLDVYVEAFKANKPLPLLTTLCGIKEKKDWWH